MQESVVIVNAWLLTNRQLLNMSTQKPEDIWPPVFEPEGFPVFQMLIWLSFHQAGCRKQNFGAQELHPLVLLSWMLLHGQRDFDDVIKVTNQLILKVLSICTSPEKQRSFLAGSKEEIRGSKHEINSVCHCWLRDGGKQVKEMRTSVLQSQETQFCQQSEWVEPQDRNPTQLTLILTLWSPEQRTQGGHAVPGLLAGGLWDRIWLWSKPLDLW